LKKNKEAAMTKHFDKGDTVKWPDGHGAERYGTVVKELDIRSYLNGERIEASPQNPKYLVQRKSDGIREVIDPENLYKIAA
jgi:hypothetical protein